MIIFLDAREKLIFQKYSHLNLKSGLPINWEIILQKFTAPVFAAINTVEKGITYPSGYFFIQLYRGDK